MPLLNCNEIICPPVLAKHRFTATHTASFVMRYQSGGHFHGGVFALVHVPYAERMTSWATVSLMLHEFGDLKRWILGRSRAPREKPFLTQNPLSTICRHTFSSFKFTAESGLLPFFLFLSDGSSKARGSMSVLGGSTS